MARSSASSASSIANASVSVGALAVTRIFSPSMPMARNAIVGFDLASRASIRPAIRSPRVDSASPHVRIMRLRITAVEPDRRLRSGMTPRPSISSISIGTPGMA